MAGLLVVTWMRFFGWLALGMVIFFSWGRYWSEFANKQFRHLIEEEEAKTSAMDTVQIQQYKLRRKRPGAAWLLCSFFGVLGAHQYYLRNFRRAIIYTALFCGAIVLRALDVFVPSATMISLSWAVVLLLTILALVDLFQIVVKSVEYNVATARVITDSEHR
jgi:TM2 domain-containing membrane protein YozV